MSNYVFTKKGAEWVANRIASAKNTKDIDVMYVVYTNGNIEGLNLTPNMVASNLFDEATGIWCLKREGGIVGYSTEGQDGSHIANISCVVTKDDVVAGGSIPLISNVSKIIAVATAISDYPEELISICNVTKSGVAYPIPWIDNISMSVSCPICVSPYPKENN